MPDKTKSITVREVPIEVHEWLKLLAKENFRSLDKHILAMLVEEYKKAQEQEEYEPA